MEFIIVIVSLVIFCALVWASIAAAIALRRIAAEAAQLRRIMGVLAETEIARGKNEISSIKCANGYAEMAQLVAMPDPHGTSASAARAAKINNIMRQ